MTRRGDKGTRVSTCLWALTHRVASDSHLASQGLSFPICKVEVMTASTSLGGSGNHKSQQMGKPFCDLQSLGWSIVMIMVLRRGSGQPGGIQSSDAAEAPGRLL